MTRSCTYYECAKRFYLDIDYTYILGTLGNRLSSETLEASFQISRVFPAFVQFNSGRHIRIFNIKSVKLKIKKITVALSKYIGYDRASR